MTSPLLTYTEAAKAIAHFRLACYRFVLRAVTSLHLPPYKGSTFHGGFGHAFKHTVCVMPEEACSSCLVPTQCLYPHIFETTFETHDAPHASDTALPRPYILLPPLDPFQLYQPGDLLTCNLVLVGEATNYLPHFLIAFETLGRLGIGQGKGQFAITHIQGLRPHAPAYELYPPGRHDPIRGD